MGCGTSTKSNIDRENKLIVNKLSADFRKTEFNRNKENYNKIHSKFKHEVLNIEFMTDLDALEKKQNITDSINNLWEKHNKSIKEANINKDQFKNLILEIIAEKIITNKFFYEEYDTSKFIHSVINNKLTKITPELKTVAIEILNNKEGCYMKKQKGVVYFIDKIEDEILPFWNSINENLKYNNNICINILTLVLTPALLNKDNILDDIIQLIEYNEQLTTVNIVVYPIGRDGKLYDSYSLNPRSYKFLFKIFESIKNNNSIKVVIFNCAKDYKITIPPEISNQLLEKIVEDSLIAFHMGNFLYSDEFLKKSLDEISLSKNLLYFGIQARISNTNLNLLHNSLVKNKSLSAILLGGFEHSEIINFVEEMKNNIIKNKNVNFFHYDKDFNLII